MPSQKIEADDSNPRLHHFPENGNVQDSMLWTLVSSFAEVSSIDTRARMFCLEEERKLFPAGGCWWLEVLLLLA
jgi:hypothetical protein